VASEDSTTPEESATTADPVQDQNANEDKSRNDAQP
jgi:hypothetical protein